MAEETGLLTALGDFVLSNARETVGGLEGVGCRAMKVAVSLSPLQFEQTNPVENIMDLLAGKNAPASLLELEITETTMMINLEDTVAKLHLLVDAGVSISIDDFGSGYSPL